MTEVFLDRINRIDRMLPAAIKNKGKNNHVNHVNHV